MREEAYDHVKDRIAMAGGDPSSPNKKDATTQPYRRADKVKGKTVYQKQAEKKYGKGVTALDIVKSKIKKSGGKIMGEETLQEKSQEGGRSNFGKASVRNMRRFGYGGNNAARLGQGEKRGEAIDKRTAEHKAGRGVKGSTQKREDKMKPVKWSDKNNNDNRTEQFTAEAMDSGSGVGYEPGKPAAKLGAIKLISKKEADAARERILAKTKAKRKAKGMSEGMYDIDPKTGKSPVASSVEKGNKKKGEKRLKHFAKLAKKMVGEGTVAKEMCKKNCGCGQDPCITYGEQTQKPAAARPADKVMVNELSKKTYSSYVKKAATEIGTSAMKGDYKKMQKRHKGVLDASDKLQKEELKMTKKEYSKIHKDFKSDDPKKPRTTKYVPGKGTVSMPVKFVDEEVYTGPKKGDLKGYGSEAFKKYVKNMDPKKRQALKDKATKGMKFTHEETNIDEAMSSYDRNRKAAAKRAAERNRLRRAGKMGGRMENETYRTEGGVRMHHKGYKAEGMSYGLYRGSGKPSGPMAAFGKKNKLNKTDDKKKKVQSFKKFKAGQEPASASAPDMSEATLATARKNIGRDPKKKSCWKGYKATGTKMKDGRAVPDCKPV
tara:strand:- start:3164 stop:4972 length:1809 start_codon:yes stop_codon:yes gene_type:complete